MNDKLEQIEQQIRGLVITQIKMLMTTHKIDADDLNGAAPKVKATKAKTATKRKKREPAFKGPQPMKYRDPKSGAEWSGFGRAPGWIATAKNRDKFLIQ